MASHISIYKYILIHLHINGIYIECILCNWLNVKSVISIVIKYFTIIPPNQPPGPFFVEQINNISIKEDLASIEYPNYRKLPIELYKNGWSGENLFVYFSSHVFCIITKDWETSVSVYWTQNSSFAVSIVV